MAVVSIIPFSLLNFICGLFKNMVGRWAAGVRRPPMRAMTSLENTIITQYGRFTGNVLSGDFRLCYRVKWAVDDLIIERPPAMSAARRMR